MNKIGGILRTCLVILMVAGCAPHSDTRVPVATSNGVVYENIYVTAKDGREVDVRVFFKASGCQDCRLILFSHGANATYDRYDVLLKAWALEGYVVVAPLHVDSEIHPERAKFGREEHLPTRVEDFAAVLQYLKADGLAEIEAVSLTGEYVAAGHSFGALIAQIFGGAVAGGQSMGSPQRPMSVIAISPPGPVPGLIPEPAWSTIEVPMLVVTGTSDIVPFVAPEWEDHLKSFQGAPEGLSGALIFDGINHYFNGAFGRIDDQSATTGPVELLNAAISAFIDQSRRGVPIKEMRLLSGDLVGVSFVSEAGHD